VGLGLENDEPKDELLRLIIEFREDLVKTKRKTKGV
jgi:hypothetical protein